jgi:hypothetical protein
MNKNLFALRIASVLLVSSLFCQIARASDPASYYDGFETTLDPFWTPYQQNGTVVCPSTSQVHSGTAALFIQGTGGGQKYVYVNHDFDNPQYGKVTVWVYDSMEYIYFSLMLHSQDNTDTGIGTQDWDGSDYYYGTKSGGGKSTAPRSVGWHKWEVTSTINSILMAVDGQTIYSGPGGQPFIGIKLNVSGPGGGSIGFDDFSFEAAPAPVPLQITSLGGNGQLTWTNMPGFNNGLFTVEWSATLGTNWHSGWDGLQSFPGAGSATTVEVPMFYRVKCVTNLFIPWIPGAQLNFAVSNTANSTWTEQIKVLGIVKPSAGSGNEFALIEDTEAGQMKLHLMRSTDTAVNQIDQTTLAESQEFFMGPIGTTWTNLNYNGQFTRVVTVDAIETVTVPAGTFTNCYKFHKTVLNASQGETAEWYEWICPGFGMVKWVDYWVDATNNPPITHNLQSWQLSAP